MNKSTAPTQILAFALPEKKGTIRLEVDLETAIIRARLDRPGTLKHAGRKVRRMADRWIKSAMSPLDADPRPMALLTFEDGCLFSSSNVNPEGRIAIAFY